MDFSAIKALIQQNIRTNNNEDITGNVLQQVLLGMIETLGDDAINDILANVDNIEDIIQDILNGDYGDGVYDISANHGGASYASISAALGTNGANVPEGLRKGGMSVKFVQSSDNKYVQYRLMSDTFNTTLANWQGVDDEPTVGSGNLVKSGGVLEMMSDYLALDKKVFTPNYVMLNNGEIVGNNDYVATLEYIPIYSRVKIICNNIRTSYTNVNIISFYDADKVFISGIVNNSTNTVVVEAEDIPANAKYVRFSSLSEQHNPGVISIFLYSLPEILDEIRARMNDIQLDIEDNAIYRDYTSLGTDIFTVGKYVKLDGTIGESNDFAATDYLDIVGNTKSINLLACQSGNIYMALIAFYDHDKKFISMLSGVTYPQQAEDYVVTTSQIPSGACYIRVSAGKIQVDAGTCGIEYVISLKEETDYLKLKNYSIYDIINENAIYRDYTSLGTDIFTVGEYVMKDGSIGESNDFAATDYLDIVGNKKSIKLLACQSGNIYVALVAFYDHDKKFISMLSGVTPLQAEDYTVTTNQIPSDACYIRVSAGKIQIDAGTCGIEYTISLKEEIDYLKLKNYSIYDIINENAIYRDYTSLGTDIFTVGEYVMKDGSIGESNDFAATDYLDIVGNKKSIKLLACQSGNIYMALVAFYDHDKKFISMLSGVTPLQAEDYVVTTSQIPSDACYIRVSAGKIQVDAGICGIEYTISLKEETDYLKSKLYNIKNNIRLNSFRGNAELTPNEYLSLQETKVQQYLLSANIKGSITKVSIGVGYVPTGNLRTYEATWIEIDATYVKVYGYYNYMPYQLRETYEHGLTITGNLTVIISRILKNGVFENTLKICKANGEVFTQLLENWGQGAAFIQNNNTSGNLDVTLSFMPRNITKNIWVFGDSMFSYWPPYVYELNATNWLRDSQPGASPDGGLSDLTHLLSLGYIPAIAVWCLGANGDVAEEKVDGNYVINNYQKYYIDAFLNMCEQHNIVPILTCIPTYTTRQKNGFRTYVKSLGVRYIDLYEAVGADEYGIWHNGPSLYAYTNENIGSVYIPIPADGHVVSVGDYLFDIHGDLLPYSISSVGTDTISATVNGNTVVYTRNVSGDVSGLIGPDGLHPSQAGAKVMAERVLVDVPELSILE